MGAALYEETSLKTATDLIHSLENDDSDSLIPQDTMDKLFENQAELDEFRTRHAKATANYKNLSEHHGAAFLGIDAGSTTTKVVLIDDEGNILYDRQDASDYVFRVLGTRGMELLAGEVSIRNRRVGEINQANEAYGRYQGEVEITKQVLPPDKRQNVVGHILEKDTFLLSKLPEGYGIVLSKV